MRIFILTLCLLHICRGQNDNGLFPDCTGVERTKFMQCRSQQESAGMSSRTKMRDNYCTIVKGIMEKCFEEFGDCATVNQMKEAKEKFMIKEFVSASLHSDLFDVLLDCPPTKELLGGRFDLNAQGSNCKNVVAPLKAQMNCTKTIIPTLIKDFEDKPLLLNGKVSVASLQNLQDLRRQLCTAARNITIGQCNETNFHSQCEKKTDIDLQIPSFENATIVKFYGKLVLYNLNRFLSQRQGYASVRVLVQPITKSCLEPPESKPEPLLAAPRMMTLGFDRRASARNLDLVKPDNQKSVISGLEKSLPLKSGTNKSLEGSIAIALALLVQTILLKM